LGELLRPTKTIRKYPVSFGPFFDSVGMRRFEGGAISSKEASMLNCSLLNRCCDRKVLDTSHMTIKNAKDHLKRAREFREGSHAGGCSLPQRMEGIKRAITASEVAALLAVSPITIYKMAKAGRLPSFRIGTAVRFDPRALAEWLRSMHYRNS
jgi:excisionase family DNA binding protein